MKTMRDRFPWLTIPESIQSEIEIRMPQFILQEAAGNGDKYMKCTACGNAGRHSPIARNHGHAACPYCMEPVEVVDHLRMKSQPGGEVKGLRRYCNVMIFLAVDGILWAIDARATRAILRNSFDGPDFYTDMDFYVFSVYRFEPGCAEQHKWGVVGFDRKTQHWKMDWKFLNTPIEPTNQGYMVNGDGTYAVFGMEEAARADAEARAKALEDKLKTADGDAAVFKVYFTGVQEDLNRMLGMIQKAKPEQKEKYKTALRALLDSVGGAL